MCNSIGATVRPLATRGRRGPMSTSGSPGVRAHHLAAIAASQCAVGWQADAFLEEVDRTVGKEHVGAARMSASESFGCGGIATAERRACALPFAIASRVGGREGIGVPAQ